MKVIYESDYPLTDESAKAATGRTMSDWFKFIDSAGGPDQGRKKIVELLWKEQGVDPWWANAVSVEYERSKNLRKKDGTLQGYMICVSKTVGAGADLAFNAFTKPALLAHWFAEKIDQNLAVGGAFESSDGNRGTYKNIQPGKTLKFTWEGQDQEQDTVVEVKFQPKDASKCSIMLTHDRIGSKAEADGLRKAWGEAFDKLKKCLEKGE